MRPGKKSATRGGLGEAIAGIVLEFSTRDILQMNRNFGFAMLHLTFLPMRNRGTEPIWFLTNNDREERKPYVYYKRAACQLFTGMTIKY